MYMYTPGQSNIIRFNRRNDSISVNSSFAANAQVWAGRDECNLLASNTISMESKRAMTPYTPGQHFVLLLAHHDT